EAHVSCCSPGNNGFQTAEPPNVWYRRASRTATATFAAPRARLVAHIESGLVLDSQTRGKGEITNGEETGAGRALRVVPGRDGDGAGCEHGHCERAERARQRAVDHVLGLGARRLVPAVRRERGAAHLLRDARADAADHRLR